MAWYVGFILAVGLLGCTRTCQMAPESRTSRTRMYVQDSRHQSRTGRDGDPVTARPAGASHRGAVAARVLRPGEHQPGRGGVPGFPAGSAGKPILPAQPDQYQPSQPLGSPDLVESFSSSELGG